MPDYLHRDYTTPIPKKSSLVRLAAVQRIECKQNLAGLAPKACFIATQTIEGEIWEIGEAQKASGEVDGRTIRFQIGTA
jgi:hypothetical protein